MRNCSIIQTTLILCALFSVYLRRLSLAREIVLLPLYLRYEDRGALWGLRVGVGQALALVWEFN